MEQLKRKHINLINKEVVKIGPLKESASDFFISESYHLISRQHKGDENGNTWCEFAEFGLSQLAIDKKLNEVYVIHNRNVKIDRESSSEVICQDGEVILGRKHTGDENGVTEYKIGRVYVGIKDMDLLIPCVTINRRTKECKESSGEQMHLGGLSMVGRTHKGDENGKTIYTFADIAIPILEK